MDYVSKLGDKVFDFVLDVSIRHVGYIINYKGNVEELKKGIEALEQKSEIVEHKIVSAKHNVLDIERDSQDLVKKAKERIEQWEEFQNDEAHTKTGCSRGILPFLWYRHKLGRKAKRLAMDVQNLSDQMPKVDEVSYQLNPRADTDLYNAGYVEFESRKKTMKDIMKQLADPTVSRIGVYGPGGVGKTTLVKEIAKRARDSKSFDKVVKVIITANPNLEKIQDEIAYQFGLKFEGESENGRAVLLRKRLKQENGNILVILDDLWDGLDLSVLGISFDDDDLGLTNVKDRKDADGKMVKNEDSQVACKGCKILLTSRSKEVLSNKMNVKENSIFPVMELVYEEAKTLFEKVAETSDKHSKLIPEIVKFCAGLPMVILTVGKTLRNKSELVWEDALEKLKRQELMGVQNYMEISVRLSYNQLESEELKSIFLLCAQMGHQPLIWDLVKYCFGLGILEGVHTLREARDRVSESIQKIRYSSLLMDVSSSDHFNMHDLVRDAALSIAHKDQNVFTLRNGKLEDWPDEIERCTVISIYKSDIVDELPKVMNCPHLRIFHIDSDDPNLKIPDRLFARMKKLKVLILIGINLRSLPSSIKRLSNLRMLCLERCVLGNFSIIKDLKKLRILSFSGSTIEEWPAELGHLNKLQLLDISDCSICNLIPPNFVSSLTNLEELYIRKSLIEGESSHSQISFLSEMKHLHQLKVVDVCFPSSDVFPTDLFFDKLDDYKIVIGYFKTLSIGDFKMPYKYEASRSLALQLNADTDIHSLKGVKMLFKRVENLLLGELNGVQNAFCELNLDGFPNLKSLSIINNIDIKYIVNSMGFSNHRVAFPNLDSLCLFKLTNLEKICCSPVTNASFSSLKIIKVKMCTNLKNIFSFHIVKLLTSLEAIDIFECDHLEVIVDDDGEVSNKVGFHNLRTLTLQMLPSFLSFYTNNKMLSKPQYMDREERSIEDIESVTSISVFDEKVEIPNLEILTLSSINIHMIWSGKLSSSWFQNLTKLIIEDCQKLKYLCSLSVANSLKKLKGLFVRRCHMMEKLFMTDDGDSDKSSKVCIFHKSEEIELSEMNMLKEIWPADVSTESFSSLISVTIRRCDKLDKIFPSHMEGWHRNLDSLTVTSCKSVEVIFEINPQKSPFDTKLQLIELDYLSKLKEVWRDPEGVANFSNLQRIMLFGCGALRNAMPVSVAKCLVKLEELTIRHCSGMEEIVDAGSETSDEPLEFHALIGMHFSDLEKIKCFCKGRPIIECPKLKQLEVDRCIGLLFTTESINEGRSAFSAEKVISNLECLEIGLEEMEWLKNKMDKLCMHHLKQLHLLELPSIETLYWFIDRIPNLERLQLSLDSSIRELVPSGNTAPQQRLGSVLQLKELNWSYSNIEDIGFERDPILQRIERLVLFDCNQLIKLAHSMVSFTQLTYLEVNYCYGLKNLVAASTAKSLVRLTVIKVIDCSNLEEIVANERNEDERVVENTIVFDKLITLQLENLKKLTCFSAHQSYEFSFPLLENLILRNCPLMKMFTESRTTTPKLHNVAVLEGNDQKENLYWEGDLNVTIKKVFLEYKSSLELSSYPELEQVWCHKVLVQENIFRNLESLTVENIGYLVHVIPSHLLLCFENLENLVVRNCDAVQVIFNVNDNDRVTKAMRKFPLKKLSLYGLPQLEHVWDKDPEGIIGLPALQELNIDCCNSLKSVFPASAVKDLAMLEKLWVEECEELEEIVVAEDKSNSTAVSKSFVFPSLTSLHLQILPKLKYFYAGLHKLQFPMLKELCIEECKWMMLRWQEYQVLIPDDQEINPLQKLEELSWDTGYAKMTWDLKFKKLRLLRFQHFQEQLDNAIYQILQMVPNVEKLELEDSSLKEMFSAERPNMKCVGFISHPKWLRIKRISNLKSIGLEHSWIHPIPENLQTLEVRVCPLIKNLVSGMVAFSNLTNLVVSTCNNMLYLFTSSTAKSLARLKQIEIRRCRSMQEIVCREGDESHHECGDIIFEQLQVLQLEDLPKLKCFYSGRYTLCFPSLVEVSLTNCLLMKTFCPHIKIKEDSIRLLSGDELMEQICWEGNIDTTIRKMNMAKIAERGRELEDLILGDELHFQEMWLGSMPVPDTCFGRLKRLVVDDCEFLSEVLPYNLLPLLINLEELEVRNCSHVKTIFDVKCKTNDKEMTVGPALLPFLFSLKKMVLENLPNLESVWNEDPDEVLTFPCFASLTLLDLPKLKCFFCSLHCVQLKGFGGQDVHIEEIIPNLANLSLGEKDLKMICHGHQGNPLHKIKVLDLRSFNVESHELPYGFLQKLPNIEELVVSNSSFNDIRNLVPSSACFSSLMRLSVSNCNDMVHLFTSSIAKSLAQLKEMDISSCRSIQEIVSSEGEESHDDDQIVFKQLQRLTLKYLPNLKSFYKGNFALSFPSLDKLSVNKCCRMDKFCVGTINANKLSAVYLDWQNTTLDVDLNFSIHKAFKEQLAKFVNGVEDLKLVDKPELHQIWDGTFPITFQCFTSLKSLIMERCEFLSTAIPSHILGVLPILEELKVRQCRAVKIIFEVKDRVKGKMKLNEEAAFSPPFSLKKLTFEQLPNLESVWDSDPQNVIGLQNLQEVYVNGCDRLERLFPASVVKSLVKLEKLEVQECGRLVEIVAENEAVAEGAPKEFVMPCMTSITLRSLPELKCFYPGPHNLNCPNLKQVYLFHCDKLKTFTSESQIIPEYQVDIPQALFLAEKVIPYLEFLAMSKEMAMLDGNLLHKLQALQLQCFHDYSNTFPYELLQKVPYIEKLGLSCSSFTEIFCSERPNADYDETFSHLKYLKLSSLSKLNTIGLEHSWVDQFSKSLETLQIDQCHSLRIIVPRTTSFSSLIDLNVSQCDGLVYLFTPSTSRSLCQLKNMSIARCKSLEEIVCGEAKESSNDVENEEIIFDKLETLSLQSLPKLGRFYSGNVTLSFPSLDELLVIKCPEMESFCEGAISVNVNRWTEFKFKENDRAIPLKVDLNSALRKVFLGTLIIPQEEVEKDEEDEEWEDILGFF